MVPNVVHDQLPNLVPSQVSDPVHDLVPGQVPDLVANPLDLLWLLQLCMNSYKNTLDAISSREVRNFDLPSAENATDSTAPEWPLKV